MKITELGIRFIIPVLTVIAGCQPEQFEAAVGPRSEQIDEIRDNTQLSGQEKRDALSALGLDPVLINATLSGERTANQYGGTLRTAFEKVTTAGRLTELTPDEIQLYSDAVDNQNNTSVGLTDARARAVQKFLTDNGLSDLSLLEEYVTDKGNEIPGDIPADFLKNAFVEFDHDDLIPVLP